MNTHTLCVWLFVFGLSVFTCRFYAQCPITIEATVSDLTCHGDNSGAVVISSSNWTLPLASVDWSVDVYDGQTVVTDMPAGPYIVTVTDANNCTATVNFVVEQPQPLVLQDCVADFNDNSSNLGFIQFLGTGGTGNYDIYFEGPTPITDLDAAPIAPNEPNTTYFVPENTCILAGDYTMRVVDENGCEASCGPVAFHPECRLTATTVVTQPACEEPGGNISISASGDYCNSLSFAWSGGLSGANPTDIPDGTYSVTVSDFYNCQLVLGPFTISTPQPPTLSCTATTISAPNTEDGGISIDIDGGNGPFTISYSGPMNGSVTGDGPIIDIENLSVGSYFIDLVDSLGCTASCTATVDFPPCNLTFNCVATDQAIVGEDGALQVDIITGFSPYTIHYSGPVNGSTIEAGPSINISDLPPGTYTIAVVDELGCVDSCQAIIAEVDCSDLQLNVDSNAPTCGSLNGSIGLTPIGGLGPYQYDWTPDSLDGQQNPINLSNGTYSVVLSDARNCVLPPQDIVLQEAPPLSLSCTVLDETGSNTFDGQIQIDFSGGTGPYEVQGDVVASGLASADAPFSFGGLGPGFYDLTLIDSNGCSLSCSSFVGPGGCDINLGLVVDQPDCDMPNGNIQLNLSQGEAPFLIDWADDQYDDQTDLANLPPASYALTVTDSRFCETDTLIELQEFTAFPDFSMGLPGLTCYEDCQSFPVQLIGSGPFTFTYNYTHPDLGAGSSTVQLEDGDTELVFCPQDFGLSSLAELEIEIINLQDAFCHLDTSLFRLPQVGSFLSDTLSGLACLDSILLVGWMVFDRENPSGEVMLQTVDECDSLVVVNLSFYPAAEQQIDSTLCPGESLMVAGTLFDMANPNGQVLLAGASSNGCDSTIFVSLSYHPQFSVELEGDGRACFDEPIFVDLINPSTEVLAVQLNEGTDISLPPGVHSFPVDAAEGVLVSILNIEQGNLACPLLFDGEVSVVRSRPQLAIQSLQASGGFDLSCTDSRDGVLLGQASGGQEPYVYQWSTGLSTNPLTNLGPGLTALTVTDDFGCEVSANYQLLAPPPLFLEATGERASCSDGFGAVMINTVSGGIAPYLYSLDGDVFMALDNFPFQTTQLPGDYSLTIQDVNGCMAQATVAVASPPEVQLLILPENEKISLGDSVLLRALTNIEADSLTWFANEVSLPAPHFLERWVSPFRTSSYTLYLSDSRGCRGEATIQVLVDRNVPVFVPTAFSPNGDGINDELRIFPGSGVSAMYDFEIYSRWGDAVYRAQGPLDLSDPQSWTWDGRFNGRALNPGLFVYRFGVTYLDGRSEILTGEVTLLR
ncbi:MAG: gliding motility-associated C-terminal domain-containing protein [Bacteroidota bacterium]